MIDSSLYQDDDPFLPDFSFSYTVAAPDQVASLNDGIAATVSSIDEAYAESSAIIAKGNALLTQMLAQSAAEADSNDTSMAGEAALGNRSAVDELNDVDPKLDDPDL
jgi:hypothetical protein